MIIGAVLLVTGLIGIFYYGTMVLYSNQTSQGVQQNKQTFYEIVWWRSVFYDILCTWNHAIPRFLQLSMTFWYAVKGTIFNALNFAHPDSAIRFCTEWASFASTIHTNVCSNPEWYCCNIFTLFLVRTSSSCSAFFMTSLLISTSFSGQLSRDLFHHSLTKS